MTQIPSQPQVVSPPANAERAIQRHATCPLCHTTNTALTNDALAAGAWWRCGRCGQRWNAGRLATVAAAAAASAERATKRHAV
jgi:ribosomal protein L37AE/L43A